MRTARKQGLGGGGAGERQVEARRRNAAALLAGALPRARHPRSRISEAVLDAVSRSSSRIAVIAADLAGQIEYVNPAAERITGYSARELKGRSLSILVEPETLQGVARHGGVAGDFEAVVASLRDGTVVDRQEWTLRRPDGQLVSVAVTLTAADDLTGEAVGLVAVVEDVSAYERAEQVLHRALEQEHRVVDELRALDQMRTEFAVTVSHELRTPVSSVLGYTELLLSGEAGALTTDQRGMLERVDRNGQRLRTLLEDLLELSEASPPSPTQSSMARVDDIVADALTIHHSMIAARDLEVGLEVLEPDLSVHADIGQLRRAVSHLLSNAIKFTPEGGTVRLKVDRVDDHAVIAVCDTGLGIPADEVDAVFDEFYRGSLSRRHATQGVGVGLPIAKGIIVAHRGTIDVDSVDGEGTVVTISIPLAPHLPGRC